MVENLFLEIYRRLRSNQVAIIINGEDLSSGVFDSLPKLRDKLKEVGDIRIAQVMFENNIPEEDFNKLRASGFNDVVVPGNIGLSLLLDAYDLVLEKKVDFIVVGTTQDDLIPLFTEMKKNATVFAFIDEREKISDAFSESVDGIIEATKVDEVTFQEPNFSELDQMIADNGSSTPSSSTFTEDLDDLGDNANIGTFSEELIEDDDLIEEMRAEEEAKTLEADNNGDEENEKVEEQSGDKEKDEEKENEK